MKLSLAFLLAVSAFAQTAQFPAAIVTDAQLKVAKDRAQTTLNATLNASATSFTAVSTAKFAANIIVSIDNEQISICGVSGGTFTVGHSSCPNVDGRGFGGTSAASHASGALVSAYMTAWNYNSQNAEIKALETALGVNMVNVGSTPADPNWATIATIYDGRRTTLGSYPVNQEGGWNTIGNVEALVGAIKIPNTSLAANGFGLAGYAVGGSTTTAAVGVYGQGILAAQTGAWGANFITYNAASQGGTGIQGNLWGVEVDVSSSAAGAAPANARGISVVSDMYQVPVVINSAFRSELAQGAIGVHPFNVAFDSSAGSAATALLAGPAAAGNSQPSQLIELVGTSAGGATLVSNIVMDSTGNLSLRTNTAANLYLGDNATPGVAYVNASSGLHVPSPGDVFIPHIAGATIPICADSSGKLVTSGCTGINPSAALSIAIAGSFADTTWTPAIQGKLNSCDPVTMRLSQNGVPGVTSYAMSGCTDNPSSSTALEAGGGFFTVTNGATGKAGVAVSAFATPRANGTYLWDVNSLASDAQLMFCDPNTAVTLQANITNADASITLSCAIASTFGPFPSMITIGQENIHISAGTGSTLTASARGYQSTSSAAHTAGAAIIKSYESVHYTTEVDRNNFSRTSTVTGVSYGGASSVRPAASIGVQVVGLGSGLARDATHIPWDVAFSSTIGAADVAFAAAPTSYAPHTDSQSLVFAAYGVGADGSGNPTTTLSSSILLTGDGNLVLPAAGAGGVFLQAGGVNAFSVSAAGSTVATGSLVVTALAGTGTRGGCLNSTGTFTRATTVGTACDGTVMANATLSNLGVTAVNADIIPAANNTEILGSASKVWANAYSRALTSDGGLSITAAAGGAILQASTGNAVGIGAAANQLLVDATSVRANGVALGTASKTLAAWNALAPADGTMFYCSDCAVSGTPGVCTASSTGSIAFRVNGATWCL